MYYYYDVLLNFTSDDELFSFYEWEESDQVEFIKKIPKISKIRIIQFPLASYH